MQRVKKEIRQLWQTGQFRYYCTIQWRRQWHPTPILLPGKSHGWRSLVGCGPWGQKESDTTEVTLQQQHNPGEGCCCSWGGSGIEKQSTEHCPWLDDEIWSLATWRNMLSGSIRKRGWVFVIGHIWLVYDDIHKEQGIWKARWLVSFRHVEF